MYLEMGKMERLLNLSWDVLIVFVVFIGLFYIFGNMYIKAGMPNFYVERYFFSLAASVISFQTLFSIWFALGIRKEIKMFDIKMINLEYMETDNLLVKIVSFLSSSTIILFFLILITIPFLVLFNTYYRSEVQLRHNKILISPYVKTLIFVLLSSTFLYFFSMSFN